MDYPNALTFLYGLARDQGMRLGLGRVRQAAALLGDPHRAYPSVHVAGTNGKGSTAAILAACLGASGLKTGLYTSPHLHRLTERIRVAGREIGRADLARLARGMASLMSGRGAPRLTFFETLTLLAFAHFREQRVDAAVIEVGLGGRLDATNLVRPDLAIITGISIDHADRLGGDLKAIAAEKGGVIKRGVPLVTGRLPDPARDRILRMARGRRCPTYMAGRDFTLGPSSSDPGHLMFTGPFRSLDRLCVGLPGAFQIENAGVAIMALLALSRHAGWRINDRALRRGLERAVWPGRFEVAGRAPEIVLDAAHNLEGAQCLAAELNRMERRKTALVFGALEDKDIEGMLGALRPCAERVFLARPPVARGREPASYASGKDLVASSPAQAYAKAKGWAGPKGRVVVTGSIHLVASIRASIVAHVRPDPPLAL